MTMGTSIQAIIFTSPWHFSHSVMSIPNTRFKRMAHVMAEIGKYTLADITGNRKVL